MKQCLKKNDVTEALESCKGDSRKTWKIIKELQLTKGKSLDIESINGLSDEKDTANYLNHHFCQIGPKLAEKNINQ